MKRPHKKSTKKRRGNIAPSAPLFKQKKRVFLKSKPVYAQNVQGWSLPIAYSKYKLKSDSPKEKIYQQVCLLIRQIENMSYNRIFKLKVSDFISHKQISMFNREKLNETFPTCAWALKTINGLCKNKGVKLILVFDLVDCNTNHTEYYALMPYIRYLWNLCTVDNQFHTSLRIYTPLSLIHNLYASNKSESVRASDVSMYLDKNISALSIDAGCEHLLNTDELDYYVNICTKYEIPVFIEVDYLKTVTNAAEWIKKHAVQFRRYSKITFEVSKRVDVLTKKVIKETFESNKNLSTYGAVLYKSRME